MGSGGVRENYYIDRTGQDYDIAGSACDFRATHNVTYNDKPSRQAGKARAGINSHGINPHNLPKEKLLARSPQTMSPNLDV